MAEGDIDSLSLWPRQYNALRAEGITSIDRLVAMTEPELLRLPGIAKKGLGFIKCALAEKGRTLAPVDYGENVTVRLYLKDMEALDMYRGVLSRVEAICCLVRSTKNMRNPKWPMPA